MKRVIVALVIAGLAVPAWSDDGESNKYLERGDHYMSMYQFRMAAQSYKTALMHDPENQEAWEKHRQAYDGDRAIDLPR